MGHIKEPKSVDLIISSSELTKEQAEEISEFIRKDKLRRKEKLRKKKLA